MNQAQAQRKAKRVRSTTKYLVAVVLDPEEVAVLACSSYGMTSRGGVGEDGRRLVALETAQGKAERRESGARPDGDERGGGGGGGG